MAVLSFFFMAASVSFEVPLGVVRRIFKDFVWIVFELVKQETLTYLLFLFCFFHKRYFLKTFSNLCLLYDLCINH